MEAAEKAAQATAAQAETIQGLTHDLEATRLNLSSAQGLIKELK